MIAGYIHNRQYYCKPNQHFEKRIRSWRFDISCRFFSSDVCLCLSFCKQAGVSQGSQVRQRPTGNLPPRTCTTNNMSISTVLRNLVPTLAAVCSFGPNHILQAHPDHPKAPMQEDRPPAHRLATNRYSGPAPRCPRRPGVWVLQCLSRYIMIRHWSLAIRFAETAPLLSRQVSFWRKFGKDRWCPLLQPFGALSAKLLHEQFTWCAKTRKRKKWFFDLWSRWIHVVLRWHFKMTQVQRHLDWICLQQEPSLLGILHGLHQSTSLNYGTSWLCWAYGRLGGFG